MPGLVGLFTRMPRQRAEAELRRMLGVMRHESFYSIDFWSDEELGIYVGWATRRGSFSEVGLHHNETRQVALAFSGEVYPARDISQDLRAAGHRLEHCEASYLIHVAEDDPSFFAKLNGRFHGLLIDRRSRQLTLFTDRFGMHRLYWSESPDAFYFAAEAKAILAVRSDVRKIDPRGLGESITLGCVLENRTLFDGISVVPGAACWRFDPQLRRREDSYFAPQEWEGQPTQDSESFYRDVQNTFRSVLPRYFGGRDAIGMSLTGGLDTRMIMAWQSSPPDALPCYTWGGTYRDCQDVLVGREVAKACRQPYHVVSMGDDFLSRFDYYADRAVYLSDGCVDLGLAPDVYMNECARRIAPVRMTGLYGGEIMRRVRAFKPILPSPGLFPELTSAFQDASRTFDRITQGHALTFAAFRQATWHHYGSLCLEETQVSMRSPFLDNEFVKAFYRAPDSACVSNDVSMRLIRDGNRALASIPTDRGLDGSGSLRERLLHSFQEFTFKAEYAYDYGMPQSLSQVDFALRRLHLDRLFLGRHKALHFRIWYANRLAPYVRDVLLDPRSLGRSYVDRKTLEHVVHSHTGGYRNYTSELHKLLKLELLHRRFIDSDLSTDAVTENSLIVNSECLPI